MPLSENLVETNRTRVEDKTFVADEDGSNYSNYHFIRVASKGRTFQSVDFTNTIFESSYFRNCTFVSCKFTGCRFIANNFRAARFSGCDFDYATFERTLLEDDILHAEAPRYENLRVEFARSLRMNFQQLGDASSANEAIRVELEATEVYLHYAWTSKDNYYRNKYTGLKRWSYFFRWLRFTLLDFAWGNGESPWKLARFVALILLIMAIFDAIALDDPTRVISYWHQFVGSGPIFIGVTPYPVLPHWYLAVITAIRLGVFGAFVSISVKRLSRR